MLTKEQKEWIVQGFCGSFEGCGKKCPIWNFCDQFDLNFAEFSDNDLDDCIKIIAPNLLDELRR